MTINRIIIWEHVNYHFNDHTKKLEDYSGDLEETEYTDSISGIDEKIYDMLEKKSIAVNTPFGIYDIKEALVPTKHFEFWLGHTNFNLDKETILKLSRVEGVEVLKIISRYRFLLATGKAFSFPEVRKKIEKRLLVGHPVNIKNIKKINNKEDLLGENFLTKEASLKLKEIETYQGKWFFYMFPNGSFEYILDNSSDNFDGDFLIYKEMYDKLDGVFLTNVI